MSDAASIVLSSYASSLPAEAKSRYLDKVRIMGGINPFCTTTLGHLERSDDCPPVDACNLLLDLMLRTSFVTIEQLGTRGIQPIRVWLGKGHTHIQGKWKIYYNWKGGKYVLYSTTTNAQDCNACVMKVCTV